MSRPEDFVEGHERLTDVFGKWPSFHDAEILALGLERCRGEGPSLLLVIQLLRLSAADDSHRLFERIGATLRLHDCEELKLDIATFNGQNQLEGLRLSREEGPSSERAVQVRIDASYGVGGTLRCRRVKVVETALASNEGDGTLSYVEPSADEPHGP